MNFLDLKLNFSSPLSCDYYGQQSIIDFSKINPPKRADYHRLYGAGKAPILFYYFTRKKAHTHWPREVVDCMVQETLQSPYFTNYLELYIYNVHRNNIILSKEALNVLIEQSAINNSEEDNFNDCDWPLSHKIFTSHTIYNLFTVEQRQNILRKLNLTTKIEDRSVLEHYLLHSCFPILAQEEDYLFAHSEPHNTNYHLAYINMDRLDIIDAMKMQLKKRNIKFSLSKKDMFTFLFTHRYSKYNAGNWQTFSEQAFRERIEKAMQNKDIDLTYISRFINEKRYLVKKESTSPKIEFLRSYIEKSKLEKTISALNKNIKISKL